MSVARTPTHRFDRDTLYELLPAFYRIKDFNEGEPLKALMEVLAEQIALIDENMAQLYDDLFIETCAEWVVPYIGDLLAVRGIHQLDVGLSTRSQVANTLAYRSRKGTASVIEQLARDVTRWEARAVEFFRLISASQHLNHLQPANTSVDLRDGSRLQGINTAFDSQHHTAEVRSGGLYNIPVMGVFLWRTGAYSLTRIQPARVAARQYLFTPLAINTELFNLGETEETIRQLAQRVNISDALPRRYLDLYQYYGEDKSLAVYLNGSLAPLENIHICNLSDVGGVWANLPSDHVAIDPVLGRLALPQNQPEPGEVRVSFYYGSAADLGGGEYRRTLAELEGTASVSAATVTDGMLAAGTSSATMEIPGGVHQGVSDVVLAADQHLVIRCPQNERAYLHLSQDWVIDAQSGAELILDGLTVWGGAIIVRGDLSKLTLRHCTLVPGIDMTVDGIATQPGAAALIVESSANLDLSLEYCITGAMRVLLDNQVSISNSVIDANDKSLVAFAAADGDSAASALRIVNSTVIGKVHCQSMPLASNTLFSSALTAGDSWAASVWVERQQIGCVRFSYLPITALVPQRYQCHSEVEAGVYPRFKSLRYGDAHYLQLYMQTAPEILNGADDESEMGVYHDTFAARKISNLSTRLAEYLPFGMQAVTTIVN